MQREPCGLNFYFKIIFQGPFAKSFFINTNHKMNLNWMLLYLGSNDFFSNFDVTPLANIPRRI
jgi:hypothetical protein